SGGMSVMRRSCPRSASRSSAVPFAIRGQDSTSAALLGRSDRIESTPHGRRSSSRVATSRRGGHRARGRRGGGPPPAGRGPATSHRRDRTNAEGVFALDDWFDQGKEVEVELRAPRYAAASRKIDVPEEGFARLDVALEPAALARVHGTIVDTDGKPVPGAFLS